MNLYFLSLLKSTTQRRKEISVTYLIDGNPFYKYEYKPQEIKYEINSKLKTRFPFLCVGDCIEVKMRGIRVIWTGSIFVEDWKLPSSFNSYPYFFDDNPKRVSSFIQNLISKSHLEKKYNCLFIPNLKIGRRRYDVYLFSFYCSDEKMDFDLNRNLKYSIERKLSCYYDWFFLNMNDIKVKQKKILQIVYR
jgi:hypothetical protein